MAQPVVYSNAEKLLAVVEAWSKPLIAQLPLPYSLLAPAAQPMLAHFLANIPDASIPGIVNDIIDNAVNKGSITIWKVTLDKVDLVELQKLIRLNLPCERKQAIGYEVKTN